ncbi:VWA domain-containing protein [Pirellulaceae bacterium SH467]
MNKNQHDRSPPSLASWISFLVSFLVHLTACLALAVLLIGGQGNSGNDIVISMSSSSDSETESLALLELDSVQPELTEEINEPVEITTPTLDVDVQVEIDASQVVASDLSAVRQASGVRAGVQDAEEEASQKTEGQSKAQFFGAEASGNRFVFVIDSSGSMRGPRWEALCVELERALKSLSTDQEFFVISFDSMPHPMFDQPPPQGKFLTAVPRSVRRVRNWLRSLNLGSNTYPASSLAMALSLQPDAIFLLSDGEIMDNTVNELRTYNRVRSEKGYEVAVPIHTVLLHSVVGFQTLERIAEENDGTFTPVPFGNRD